MLVCFVNWFFFYFQVSHLTHKRSSFENYYHFDDYIERIWSCKQPIYLTWLFYKVFWIFGSPKCFTHTPKTGLKRLFHSPVQFSTPTIFVFVVFFWKKPGILMENFVTMFFILNFFFFFKKNPIYPFYDPVDTFGICFLVIILLILENLFVFLPDHFIRCLLACFFPEPIR